MVQAENDTKFLPFHPILPAEGVCGEGGGLDHKAGQQNYRVLILPSAIIHSASTAF